MACFGGFWCAKCASHMDVYIACFYFHQYKPTSYNYAQVRLHITNKRYNTVKPSVYCVIRNSAFWILFSSLLAFFRVSSESHITMSWSAMTTLGNSCRATRTASCLSTNRVWHSDTNCCRVIVWIIASSLLPWFCLITLTKWLFLLAYLRMRPFPESGTEAIHQLQPIAQPYITKG